LAENAEDPAESEPKQKSSQDRGEETAGSRGSEPIEVESRSFSRWLRYDRRRP
jgi:hypothetical protein